MTKLSDSSIKIKLGDKDLELHVTLKAVLEITSAGQIYVEDGALENGNPRVTVVDGFLY